MSNQKKEITSKSEMPAINHIPDRCCNAQCMICNSDHLIDIHKLRKAGKTFVEIVTACKTNYNLSISTSGLSRHFKNYQKQKDLIAAKIINGDIIEEATKQATHTKRLVKMIDDAFDILSLKFKNRAYNVDISDLEKLMKLRYQVLGGQDADDKDVMAIFQKASSKYGLNLQQGILFGKEQIKS